MHDNELIGSPDRPKQMPNPNVTVHHRSNMDCDPSSSHHEMSYSLAKPVAMRRLSEKSIAHARATLTSPDAVLESMYNPGMCILDCCILQFI